MHFTSVVMDKVPCGSSMLYIMSIVTELQNIGACEGVAPSDSENLTDDDLASEALR